MRAMTAAAEPDDDDISALGEDAPAYAFKPSLVGAPSIFALGPTALHWQIGRRAGRVRYDRVRRIRMVYRPATMQTHRYLTEIWSDGNPKLQIVSASWRGMMAQERLDADYTAFIAELHRRLAAAGSTAQFLAGMPAPIYWLGVAVFVAILGVMGWLTVSALQLGQWSGVAIVALFFAVFAIQVGTYFRRNRPLPYRPEALPAAVLPRGR
jgi:hypothetical protein